MLQLLSVLLRQSHDMDRFNHKVFLLCSPLRWFDWSPKHMASRSVGTLPLAILLAALSELALAAETLSTAPAKRAAIAERRLALVIGNSAYPAAPLRNPVNDVKDFGAALADSGFEVTRLENANLREMRSALRDFGDRLKKEGGVGLFYFAGHGMQVKGRNYLIPVAAQIEREDEVEFESLDANLVLEKLDSAGNRFNIVIFDACRNNPFARSFRSSTQGLAQMDAPTGAVVAFATSPGSVASDGGGRNGLYSQHLIESVRRPGLKIEEVFKQVRAAVRRDSSGKQTPWESTSLEGDFYFHPVDLNSADAARKQQEQERLETAVRVAIAQERERIRKEFEQATVKGALPPAAATTQNTIIAAQSLPEPDASLSKTETKTADSLQAASNPSSGQATTEAAAAPPAAAAPTVVASIAPHPTPASNKVDPATPGAATTAFSQVIGTRLQGPIAAPQFAVGDEWELLTITSNPSHPAAEPTSVIERLTAISFVQGGQLGLYRERLDKAGGTPVGNPRTYFVSGQLETAFYGKTAIAGLQKILVFPFNPPERWSYSFEYPTDNGAGKGRDAFESKVVGWEQVTVPAGTFWAVKVEQPGWRNNVSVSGPGSNMTNRAPARLEFTFWYSPETKSIVQSIRKQFGGTSSSGLLADAMITEQLVRFTTAASRAASTTTATQ
jgi:hypothetical protein